MQNFLQIFSAKHNRGERCLPKGKQSKGNLQKKKKKNGDVMAWLGNPLSFIRWERRTFPPRCKQTVEMPAVDRKVNAAGPTTVISG